MAKSRGRKFAEITSPTSGVFDLTSVPTITNAKLQNSAMTLAGSSVSLGGTGVADTDALSEGSSNLYFTNARVQSFLGGGTLAGNIVVPDNRSIYLGSSSDFRLVHNTSDTQLINATGELQITSNGGVAITGAATFSSTITTGGITINGAGSTISDSSDLGIVSGGDLTMDVTGDIILDADGGDVNFKDAGTEYLRITNATNGPEIFSPSNDGDLFFKGTDGGSTITALTLDMSEGGRATFNEDVLAPGLYVGTRNASFDFYNNGTGYNNGAFTVDDTLSVTGAATFNSTISSGAITTSALINAQISHTSTDVTAANSNSTLRLGNSGAGNGIYNALKFSGNQQDMYIMSFNNNQQADRRLGFFVGSVAGDATTDERLSIKGDGKVGIGIANSGGLPLQTKVSSGDNKFRQTTANKDAFTLGLDNSTGDTIIGTHTTYPHTTFKDGGNLEVNGEVRPTSHLVMNGSDSQKIYMGAGNDLEIYHDGVDNVINAGNNHSLRIRFGGTNQWEFHNSNYLKGNDGKKIILGDSSDLQIYHDGNHSYVHEQGTGALKLRTDEIRLEDSGGNNRYKIPSNNRHLFYGMNTTSSVGSWAFGHTSEGSSGGYMSSWTTVFGQRIHLRTNGSANPSQHGTVSFSGSSYQNFRIMQNVGYNGVYWNASTQSSRGAFYEMNDSSHYWQSTNSVSSGAQYTPFTTMWLDASGNLRVKGLVDDYYTFSDERLKQDVEDLPSALDKVKALRTVKFNWINEEQRRDRKEIGLIAQEVKEIYPELIHTSQLAPTEDEDTLEKIKGEERYAMEYEKLSVVLLKAMQEQQELIETLQTKVAALEAK